MKFTDEFLTEQNPPSSLKNFIIFFWILKDVSTLPIHPRSSHLSQTEPRATYHFFIHHTISRENWTFYTQTKKVWKWWVLKRGNKNFVCYQLSPKSMLRQMHVNYLLISFLKRLFITQMLLLQLTHSVMAYLKRLNTFIWYSCHLYRLKTDYPLNNIQ